MNEEDGIARQHFQSLPYRENLMRAKREKKPHLTNQNQTTRCKQFTSMQNREDGLDSARKASKKPKSETVSETSFFEQVKQSFMAGR